MLSALTSLKPSTGLSTNYCSRRSTDSASAVPCCFGSKTILLTASKGSPFSGSTLNPSLCFQVYRKDQYLVHIYVNDLPYLASLTSVALFADDTKCYRTIESMEDSARLLMQIDLNQSKCGLLSITRNASPHQSITRCPS